MIVLVITACPAGLRGQLTRWLLEIAPGVFVGRVSRRVRDLLWTRVVKLARNGRAILVFSTRNEQRLDFRVHDSDWEPVDFDGVHLMRRPPADSPRSGRRRRISQGVGWDDDWSDVDAVSRLEGFSPGFAADNVGGDGHAPPDTGWSAVSRRRKAARTRAARLRHDSAGEGGSSAAPK